MGTGPAALAALDELIAAHPALELAGPTAADLNWDRFPVSWPPPGHWRLPRPYQRAGAWPLSSLSYHARLVRWDPAAAPIWGVQSRVCATTLAAKVTARQVDGVSAAADNTGQLWVYDGHHSLALWLTAYGAGTTDRVPLYLHLSPGDTPAGVPALVCSCRPRRAGS